MKRIEYKLTYQDAAGGVHEQVVAFYARSINSGARKALEYGLRPGDCPAGWEFCRLEFWQVTS